jgi:hypothetical protein
MHAFHAATKQRSHIMKEKDSRVEKSPTAKTSRRSFLKAGAAAAGAKLEVRRVRPSGENLERLKAIIRGM